MDHVLPPGQFAPADLALEDTRLPGAAFLVQTDAAFLYGISGFETLKPPRHSGGAELAEICENIPAFAQDSCP